MAAITQKQRCSNLELFRIILMLLIIAHHYVVNSDVWNAIQSGRPSFNFLFYYIFGMWGKMAINCFVLITGWFMCTSKITLRKFIKLLVVVEFYKIIIGIVFLLTGMESFSLEWLLDLLPVRSVERDFVSSFLVFFLFIPFLNTLIRNMTRQQHLLLLLLLLFLYTFLSTVPHFSLSLNYVEWFCALYCFSSFMRLYEFPFKENNRAWLFFSLVCIVVSVLSVVAIVLGGKKVDPYWFVRDSNKMMALATAICLFNFFRTLRIPPSQFVNVLGSTTFGVLLIHAHNKTMRHWLWTVIFDNGGHLSSSYYAIRAIAIVFIVFTVCSGIDYLRIVLFERPVFGFYDRIENRPK